MSIADAQTRVSERMDQPEAKSVRKRAFTSFGVALLFVLGFAIFAYFNFKTVQVSGISVDPTLKNGQRVLMSSAYWLVGPVTEGNIVVIRDNNPNGYIIKRVYRVGGELVDWRNVPKSWPLSKGEYKVPDGFI